MAVWNTETALEDYATGIVILLYTKKLKEDYKNYRGIWLLSGDEMYSKVKTTYFQKISKTIHKFYYYSVHHVYSTHIGIQNFIFIYLQLSIYLMGSTSPDRARRRLDGLVLVLYCTCVSVSANGRANS